jgi:uncharacterized Zn finger protein
MPDAGQPVIHPGVDTSGTPPPRRRRARAEPLATTWWATRFLASIEAAAGRGRLSRGLEYARGGRVDELAVEPGHASAQVQGSRPTPYRVALRLAHFDDAIWARAIARLGAGAGATAALASGALPEHVDDAFAVAGVSLFPSHDERVATACTCPDATRPCKHAAALIYALAARFDRDPFLLFSLRGKGREELLADLRVARKRSAARAGAPVVVAPTPAQAAASTPASRLAAALAADLPADPARFWSAPPRDDPPPPAGPDDTLKRLGLPPRALGGAELKMELALAYRLLADRARKALGSG